MRRPKLTYKMWILVLFVFAFRPLNASEPRPNDDELPNFSAVASQIRARIDRVHSGLVTIKGRKIVEPLEPKLDGLTEIMCAFDDGFGKMRFDRKELQSHFDFNGPVGNPVTAPPAETPIIHLEESVRFFRTPAMSGTYSKGFGRSGELQLATPDTKPRESCKPFDPRCIGLFLLSARFPTSESDVKGLLSREPKQIKREDNGLISIEWRFKIASDEGRRVLSLDPHRGMTPVRFELQMLDSTVTDQQVWNAPLDLTTVKWQSMNDVWLPCECAIESSFVGSGGRPLLGSKRSYQLQLEWSSVNEPIAPEYFDPHFVAPPGEMIIDTRVQPHVLLRQPGQK